MLNSQGVAHAISGFALVAVLLGAGMSPAFAQRGKRYVVLPHVEAKWIVGYRLGPTEVPISGTWDIQQDDIGAIEASLQQISGMSRDYPPDKRIEHPEQYFRQYLGVVGGQRKLIYVNAVCGFPKLGRPPKDWRKHFFTIIDGGGCFWQAMYDVKAREFVDFNVNGP
jgi:hypothetical protein